LLGGDAQITVHGPDNFGDAEGFILHELKSFALVADCFCRVSVLRRNVWSKDKVGGFGALLQVFERKWGLRLCFLSIGWAGRNGGRLRRRTFGRNSRGGAWVLWLA
jgi:hypothetical protein